jgi:hypothetical protein
MRNDVDRTWRAEGRIHDEHLPHQQHRGRVSTLRRLTDPLESLYHIQASQRHRNLTSGNRTT